VNNAVLPAEPAEVTFEWTPVVGARSYTLEVDPLSTCVLYKYCSDVGVYRIVENIAETHYTGSFPSQMWTRWRVWAVAGDRASLKSPWTMFQRTSGTPAPMAAALAAPEYTAAARDAGLEGTATVYFEVAASGETKNVKVLQSLGLGLDEKAEQLVSHWRFAPGAAPVQAAEVSFRLDGRQGWRVRRAYYRIIPEERREPESLKPVVKMWQSPPACPAGEYLREQISFRVGKSGVPDKVVVSSSPYASALRDAVLGWRFEPARLSGGNGRAREANAVFDLECGFPAAAAAAANGTPTKPPSVISKIDPAYSEEARQAKYNGSVSIQVIIDQDGFPIKLRIVHPIGLGLDEKALEALKQWRFNPANRGGEPVPYQATVEITFRLL
jgi:TonB family protein